MQPMSSHRTSGHPVRWALRLGAEFEEIIASVRSTYERQLRVDTTVVEAPIHYPTDSDLCVDVVRVVGRELERIEEAGEKLPFRRTDVRRSVGRRLREIAQGLRRRGDAAKEAIKRPIGACCGRRRAWCGKRKRPSRPYVAGYPR
jgi:hypothetical protein